MVMHMKIVDLTYEVYPGMFKFPKDYHPPVEFEITGTYEKHKCMVHRVIIGTHSGTHIDAPRHFFEGARSIDEVSLDRLIVGTLVINFVGKKKITRKDLMKYEENLKNVKAVLLRTDWWKKWDTQYFYKDFPLMTEEAATWLVKKGINVIAVDFPLTIEVHNVILGSDGIQIENLTNLDKLPDGVVKLIALPLKLKGLEAAPARVLAIV